jgi:hypothetical protein
MTGLKPKNMVGIPWRVAFALQADGWYLRSDIIWAKPNPMPESVTDRPTKSHEYIFLLSKRERYFWDQEAIREDFADDRMGASGAKHGTPEKYARESGRCGDEGLARFHGNIGRNIRSVWTIPTQSFSGAHFATFPREIPERCIKAGTSEKGCCPKCGAAWERIVDHKTSISRKNPGYLVQSGRNDGGGKRHGSFMDAKSETIGWRPTCSCNAGDPIPCIVLDPFCGSGTTVMVAQDLGRIGVGLDLTYQDLAAQRIGGPLFAKQVNSAWS